jgi:hypothetical protein
MADLQPGRIEPLGDGPELGPDAHKERPSKSKTTAQPVPPPPPVGEEEEGERHQLDEQA